MNKLLNMFLMVSIFIFSTPVFAAKYYCNSGEGYNIDDIYDTEGNCDGWNSDFWKNASPNAYTNCLNNQKILKQKYLKGECKPLIAKVHIFGSGKCIAELTPDTHQVVEISCNGAPRGSMEKMEAMYK